MIPPRSRLSLQSAAVCRRPLQIRAFYEHGADASIAEIAFELSIGVGIYFVTSGARRVSCRRAWGGVLCMRRSVQRLLPALAMPPEPEVGTARRPLQFGQGN